MYFIDETNQNVSEHDKQASIKLRNGMTKVKCSVALSLAISELVKAGLIKKDASRAADILLAAEQNGKHTHGFARLKFYADLVRKKVVSPDAVIEITMSEGSTRILDGHRGLGLIQAAEAMEDAMELAAQYGAGFVWLTKTSHIGCAGYYAIQATHEGKIGIVITNGAPALVPPHGKEAVTGTNPIAIAVPDGCGGGACADTGFGNATLGKVEPAVKEGRKIPGAWVANVLRESLEVPPGAGIDAKEVGRMLAPKGSDAQAQNGSMALAIMLDILLAYPPGGRLSYEQRLGEATALFMVLPAPGETRTDQPHPMARFVERFGQVPRLPGRSRNDTRPDNFVVMETVTWNELSSANL